MGSPLSPMIGAFFLKELDDVLAAHGCFFVRFMDDIVVLTPSRWKRHQAVIVVNQLLRALRLHKHPDKTFIGRMAKGFDFLGYHFCFGRLRMAAHTLARFVARARRLYEQEPVRSSSRLDVYVRRWWQWARAGLPISVGIQDSLRCATPPPEAHFPTCSADFVASFSRSLGGDVGL